MNSFQFSLRTVHFILAFACVFMGCVAWYRARLAADRAAIEAIETAGFRCRFEDGQLVAVESESDASRLTADVARAMSRFPSLSLIECHDVEIRLDAIRILKQSLRLRELVLVHCPIDDQLMRAICNMSDLESLDVSLSTITDQLVAILAKCGRLERLTVSDNPMSASAARQLGALRNLRMLDVSRTQFDDRALIEVANCKQLEILICDDTRITDAGVTQLVAIKESLTKLSLCNTDTSDNAVVALNALTRLNELDISGTFIGDQGLLQLRENKLKLLVMVGTEATYMGVTRFRELHPAVFVKSGLSLH